jgi:hypothetical protein
MNLRWVNSVKQTEVHTKETLMPDPRAFEFEMATESLKRHKSPGVDQIAAEMNQARGEILRSDIQTY